jgi:hypothetical protein
MNHILSNVLCNYRTSAIFLLFFFRLDVVPFLTLFFSSSSSSSNIYIYIYNLCLTRWKIMVKSKVVQLEFVHLNSHGPHMRCSG